MATGKVLDFPFSSRPADHVRDGGHVDIYRRLFDGDSVLGSDRRLIGAWVEMISRAAWKPIDVQIGETWFRLQRGQCVASLHEFAALWGVPWTTFYRACKRMEREGRVRLEAVRVRAKVEPRRTLITICNYDLYQASPEVREPTQDQGRTNTQEKGKQLKVTESRTNSESDSPTSEKTQTRPNGEHGQAVEAEFDSWWQLWTIAGSKRGKGQALRAFRTARKLASPEVLANRLKLCVACWTRDRTALCYIPHPATWLNGRRWEDDLLGDEKRDRVLSTEEIRICKPNMGWYDSTQVERLKKAGLWSGNGLVDWARQQVFGP